MKLTFALPAALLVMAAPAIAADGPTDPQIAHIAYTAGNIDVAAAQQALARSHTKAVRSFAQEMVRDHQAVNAKALGAGQEAPCHASGQSDQPGSHQGRRRGAFEARQAQGRGLRPRVCQ